MADIPEYNSRHTGAEIDNAVDAALSATTVVANPANTGTAHILSGLQVGNVKYLVNKVRSIAFVSMSGTVGTYRILFTDDSYVDFAIQQGLPPGGIANQILVKQSSSQGHANWESPDTTLTHAGKVAEAKSVGDRFKQVEDQLQSTFFNENTSNLWTMGTLTYAAGIHLDSTTRAHMVDFIPEGIKSISPNTNYKFALYGYNKADNAYIGYWNGHSFSTSAPGSGDNMWFTETIYLSDYDNDTLKFKLVFGKVDDTNVSISLAGSNLSIWSFTDTTLSKAGIAADALVVGQQFDNIKDTQLRDEERITELYTKNEFSSVTLRKFDNIVKTTDVSVLTTIPYRSTPYTLIELVRFNKNLVKSTDSITTSNAGASVRIPLQSPLPAGEYVLSFNYSRRTGDDYVTAINSPVMWFGAGDSNLLLVAIPGGVSGSFQTHIITQVPIYSVKFGAKSGASTALTELTLSNIQLEPNTSTATTYDSNIVVESQDAWKCNLPANTFYGGTINWNTGEIIPTYNSGGASIVNPTSIWMDPCAVQLTTGKPGIYTTLGTSAITYYTKPVEVHIDKTLSIPAMAADASVTGSNIEDLLKITGADISSDTFWEKGTLKVADGTNYASETSLRTGILPKTCASISVGVGYRFAIYAYNNGVFQGLWTGETYTPGYISWLYSSIRLEDLPNANDYNFRVIMSRVDGNNITLSECVNTKIINLTSVSAETMPIGLHTYPSSDGVLNVIKRARQLTDIKWTPAVDLPRLNMTSLTPPDKSPTKYYEGVFKQGVEYRGIPYGRCLPSYTPRINTYGKNNFYVGDTIGLDTFISSVSNPDSLLCSNPIFSTVNHTSLLYADVCSALVCYALNISPALSTYELAHNTGTGLYKIGPIINSSTDVRIDLTTLKLGDVLNNENLHVAIITDIIKKDGQVTYIETSEATVLGNANRDYAGGQYGGVCRRVGLDVETFFWRFGSYNLWRDANIDSVPYTKSPYVNVGDEFDMNPFVEFPCMPYEGEGFIYESGYIPDNQIKILINRNDASTNRYQYLRVFNGDTEISGSPFSLDSTQSSVFISTISVGSYSAYLCKMSNGDNTEITIRCHWTIR